MDEDYDDLRWEYEEELCAARRRREGRGWLNPDEDDNDNDDDNEKETNESL